MSLDPAELARIRTQLATLSRLEYDADARAGDPPRLGPDAWRGPAFQAYDLVADLLADDLRSIASDVGKAHALARMEMARGLA